MLAGAFYGNFIKCGFYSSEKIQKKSVVKDYDPKQAISVRGYFSCNKFSVVQGISDHKVQDFFRKFGKITNYFRYSEEVILAYSKEDYEDAIERVLLCSNFRFSTNEFIINYVPEGETKEVAFQLKKPEYLYQVHPL